MSNVNGTEILDALAAPFTDNEIEWRVQTFSEKNGAVNVLALPYISARSAMNRLDSVLGLNWKDEYREITINGQQAFQCALSIKVNEEWITRTDGAEATDYESVKGGYSNAFKRACVKFKIGRYLYDLPQYWLPLKNSGKVYVSGNRKGKNYTGYIDPPSLTNVSINSQANNNGNQKKVNQQSQQRQPAPSNHNDEKAAAINAIGQLINSLAIHEEMVIGMLRHIGSAARQLQQAELRELDTLYHVLKPVHDFSMVCRKANLDIQGVFYYAQIVLKQPIQQYDQLFFALNYELANEAIQLVLADQVGQNQTKQA